MPNSIVTADQDALVTEIEVAAPPSRVFEALTDAKQIVSVVGKPRSLQVESLGIRRARWRQVADAGV